MPIPTKYLLSLYMLCCCLYVHTLVPFYVHNLLLATVLTTSRDVRSVPHQSLWITHIKTCCYTANNRCRTHTTATACCSLEYSSNKYSFEMVAKVQLYSYIHKRKGHKVLKKRRKGSRQPKKKEEIPLSLNSVCPACISSVLLSSLTFCYLWGLQGFGAIRFAFGV